MLSHTLQQGLRALALELSPQVQAQLIRYVELLQKWNQAYNLTAIRDPQDMVVKHLLDSLAVLPYIQGTHFLDVGTGAGLPGLVIALCMPNYTGVLLDSNVKKTRFVQQVIGELQLSNVSVVHQRIEDYQPIKLFDTVISRAYSSLALFYHQTMPLCKPTGQIIAMKGALPTNEIAELTDISMTIKTIPLSVPLLNAERHLVVLSHG
ncbi:16S rRNA (guanine(527)-N(7))-methyltransferase GidB [Beggiatoa alba B18LD]|uniref:Ribosomal RNA small subunit methyltransferase G n=1 Tax=Beggiatoa alba B18LD TaxID=395493 RepID=I3CC03_9GAMM|nr:16S rRNA (guanine(527)-N(7))-methyltransferase RsmG [Beggiatoa alba]EIJ41146.1 16S rRNA (guanine(527)-N(7))-methyltransferase GidB [Beggiatoa alba B18LD]